MVYLGLANHSPNHLLLFLLGFRGVVACRAPVSERFRSEMQLFPFASESMADSRLIRGKHRRGNTRWTWLYVFARGIRIFGNGTIEWE